MAELHGNEPGRTAAATQARPLGRWLPSAETLAWSMVAVGCLIRVIEYARWREIYRDERSLLANLLSLSVLDFHTRLSESQLAAPGFLLVERLLVRLPFSPLHSGRFFPFVCGIASMFAMRAVARRYIGRLAVPIAVGLFAFDEWLLYYSCELKQYSTEVLLGLGALWLVAGPEPSAERAEPSGPAPFTRRRLIGLAEFGMAGVWFSFPLSFVLAAVGTYLIAAAAARKDWGLAARTLAIGAAWAASFALCFAMSHAILSNDGFIWTWWNFAFLPFPPRSWADAVRDFWHVLNVFNSPAGVLTPLGVVPSAFVAGGLFGLGSIALLRRWPGGLYLLTAPMLFALVASGLRQYPFHGRLLLFLVPALHLVVAEGARRSTRPGGRWLTFTLGRVLALPAGSRRFLAFRHRQAHAFHV